MDSSLYKTFMLMTACICIAACGTVQSTAVSETDDFLTAGYASVSKNANAFSTSEAESTDQDANFTNIYDYLRSKVPGVYVSQSSDAGSTPKIEVRGQKSIFDSNDPMILLDGTEWPDVSSIRPDEIHSVRVLKGSAASEYGSRGANGVIMFTTKFAHETQMREAAARKAEKEARKAARKN